MKHSFIILFLFIPMSSYSNSIEEDCLIKDVECRGKQKNESDTDYCQRILQAKNAGNLGYKYSYCRFDKVGRLVAFSLRFVDKKERENAAKADPADYSGAKTIESELSPGVAALENEISMGKPFAEAVSNGMKFSYMDTRDKLDYFGVNLDQCFPENTFVVPREEEKWWVLYDSINSAISSAGYLGHDITKQGRISIINAEIARGQGLGPLQLTVQAPTMTAIPGPAAETFGPDKVVMPKEVYKNYKFDVKKSNSAEREKEVYPNARSAQNEWRTFFDRPEMRRRHFENLKKTYKEKTVSWTQKKYDDFLAKLDKEYRNNPNYLDEILRELPRKSDVNLKSGYTLKSPERLIDFLFMIFPEGMGGPIDLKGEYGILMKEGYYSGYVSKVAATIDQGFGPKKFGVVEFGFGPNLHSLADTVFIEDFLSGLDKSRPKDWSGLVVIQPEKDAPASNYLKLSPSFSLGAEIKNLKPNIVDKKSAQSPSLTKTSGRLVNFSPKIEDVKNLILKNWKISDSNADSYSKQYVNDVFMSAGTASRGDVDLRIILKAFLRDPNRIVQKNAMSVLIENFQNKKIMPENVLEVILEIVKNNPNSEIKYDIESLIGKMLTDKNFDKDASKMVEVLRNMGFRSLETLDLLFDAFRSQRIGEDAILSSIDLVDKKMFLSTERIGKVNEKVIRLLDQNDGRYSNKFKFKIVDFLENLKTDDKYLVKQFADYEKKISASNEDPAFKDKVKQASIKIKNNYEIEHILVSHKNQEMSDADASQAFFKLIESGHPNALSAFFKFLSEHKVRSTREIWVRVAREFKRIPNQERELLIPFLFKNLFYRNQVQDVPQDILDTARNSELFKNITRFSKEDLGLEIRKELSGVIAATESKQLLQDKSYLSSSRFKENIHSLANVYLQNEAPVPTPEVKAFLNKVVSDPNYTKSVPEGSETRKSIDAMRSAGKKENKQN